MFRGFCRPLNVCGSDADLVFWDAINAASFSVC